MKHYIYIPTIQSIIYRFKHQGKEAFKRHSLM